MDQEVELGDPAMIIYTSGTTGPPKVKKTEEWKCRERSKEKKWIRRWSWRIPP